MTKQPLRASVYFAAIAMQALLASCGGGGGGDAAPRLSTNTVPGVPLNVTINTGDGALSLGWNPPANNGGTAIQSFWLSGISHCR